MDEFTKKTNLSDNTGRDLVTTMLKSPQGHRNFEFLRFASEAVTIIFLLPRDRGESFGNDIPSERKRIREL